MADRYDRYAEIFDNPVDAAVLELGNRVLHWQFMENYQTSTGYLVVRDHAREAAARGQEAAGLERAPEIEREAGS